MTTLREAAQQALEALEYGQHTLKRISEYQWESRGVLAMNALRAALAEPLVMQVRPSDFAKLIKGKETMTGIPAYWAEWPNKEAP